MPRSSASRARTRRIAARASAWRLADVIAQASVALDEHLANEEQEILPLAEAHVTQAEWDALGERGRESIPKGKLALIFLGSIFEEASEIERRRFLADLPVPARLVWRLLGERTYRSYRDLLRHG